MLDFATDFTLDASMKAPFWPPANVEPVASGRTAMAPAVPPWVTQAVRVRPDVAFGVDVMPPAQPGGPRGEFLAGAVLAVPSTVKDYRSAAWRFLEFVTASTDGSNYQADFGLFPAYRRAPVVQRWLSDPHRGAFIRIAQLASRGRPALEDQDFITRALNQYVGEALRRQRPAQAALDEANRILQQYFDELRRR